MRGLIEYIFRRIIKWYVERLVCQHFCKFKQAGSDLIYTHVHILSNNPEGVSGLGHDDHTGIEDDGHVTISRGGEITIQAEDEASMLLREHGYLGTAYFHQGEASGECPRGFTAIRCNCPDEEGNPGEVTVCYSMDHDDFMRWYEARQWPNQAGEYVYPYTYAATVTEDRPGQINCGGSVVIRQFAIASVDNCDGYGGANDGENRLVREARTKLQAAADKIRCEPGCDKFVEEVFRGWRCQANQSGVRSMAEAVVMWRVGCRDQ